MDVTEKELTTTMDKSEMLLVKRRSDVEKPTDETVPTDSAAGDCQLSPKTTFSYSYPSHRVSLDASKTTLSNILGAPHPQVSSDASKADDVLAETVARTQQRLAAMRVRTQAAGLVDEGRLEDAVDMQSDCCPRTMNDDGCRLISNLHLECGLFNDQSGITLAALWGYGGEQLQKNRSLREGLEKLTEKIKEAKNMAEMLFVMTPPSNESAESWEETTRMPDGKRSLSIDIETRNSAVVLPRNSAVVHDTVDLFSTTPPSDSEMDVDQTRRKMAKRSLTSTSSDETMVTVSQEKKPKEDQVTADDDDEPTMRQLEFELQDVMTEEEADEKPKEVDNGDDDITEEATGRGFCVPNMLVELDAFVPPTAMPITPNWLNLIDSTSDRPQRIKSTVRSVTDPSSFSVFPTEWLPNDDTEEDDAVVDNSVVESLKACNEYGNPVQGEYAIGKYSDDNYYRCRVVSAPPWGRTTVEVKFLDFGNKFAAEVDELLKLPVHLFGENHPQLAMELALAGVDSADVSVGEEFRNSVKEGYHVWIQLVGPCDPANPAEKWTAILYEHEDATAPINTRLGVMALAAAAAEAQRAEEENEEWDDRSDDDQRTLTGGDTPTTQSLVDLSVVTSD